MDDNKISAYTQYSDYEGNISIDLAHDMYLFDLLKKCEEDTEGYSPLSFTFSANANPIMTHKPASICSAFIDATKLKREEIEECRKNKTPLPVKRFSFDIDIDELFTYTKRFVFTVSYKGHWANTPISID